MGIGALIVGDEILSGRRADKHMSRVIEVLSARGLALDWCEYVGDDRPRLVDTLRRTFATDDIVFSFGGIGATPDDHTRHAAAAALGWPLVLHAEAEAILRAKFGEDITALRLRLAEFPEGASVIPNPYNQVAAFSVGQHHFLPGFPVMAWPMLEWVLDGRYAHLFHARKRAEASMLVFDTPESTLIPLMEMIEARYPGVTSFSLPNTPRAGERRQIDFGVKGSTDQVSAAYADACAWLDEAGCPWEVQRDQSADAVG